MKRNIIKLSLAVITVILGGCALDEHTEGFPPLRVSTKTPEHITLKTLGSPGQSFCAVLTVDGSRREISGVTPAEFPLECVVLVGEVTEVGGDGSFHFVIERQSPRGEFHTPPVKNLRRFRYYSGSISVLVQNWLVMNRAANKTAADSPGDKFNVIGGWFRR